VIRINLLPLESFRQTASGQLSVTIFAVVMILAGFLLYMVNTMFMTPAAEALESAKTAQQSKLGQMKSEAAEALKQTTSFVEQLVQVAAISELEERRRDQARLFMALAAQVNNQTSWLLGLTHSNGDLSIKGMATDHETVANFLGRLEQLPLLTNVELRQAAGDQVINEVKLVTFDINAKTIFPGSTLLDVGLPEVNLPDLETVRNLITVASPDLAPFLDRNKQIARAI
jgi:Tfp pilus assembly protein PilN